MTREEFRALPYLVTHKMIARCGYSPQTLEKYAECAILRVIQPKGCGQRRFQKVQLADLLGWMDTIDRNAWRAERPLMALGAVQRWTGFDPHTLNAIARARGLTIVQPGGIGERKFRKEEIGGWIGL